jgi:YfiH family protein
MTPYLTSAPLCDIPRLKHGFFTRQGGVSQGDFETLNAAHEKGDNPDHVNENRRRIAQALGFKTENLITPGQVHSTKVLVIDAPFSGEIPEADGLITTTPGLMIGVLSADCVPILLSSRQGDMVAVVHAGWRGAIQGIAEAAVEQMRSLGAGEIIAALGPCIWQASYEVSQEFYDNIPDSSAFFFRSNHANHWQFDLPGYVATQLEKIGVQKITPSPADTFAEPHRFFSYRRKTLLGDEKFGCSLSGIGIL